MLFQLLQKIVSLWRMALLTIWRWLRKYVFRASKLAFARISKCLAHSPFCQRDKKKHLNRPKLFLQLFLLDIIVWRNLNRKRKTPPQSRSFVRCRNMLIQSWTDKSHYCCSLTHPRTADCLRVIWSQGQSQLNSHSDTLKYKIYQESADIYGFRV